MNYTNLSTTPVQRVARVFVLEPHNMSLKNAKDFGRVVYIYDEQAERPSIWSSEFIPHVMKRLDALEYDPERDYFVIVGHQVPLVMVACGIAAEWGSIKILVFSSTERQYVPRVVSVDMLLHTTRTGDRHEKRRD